MSDQIALEGMKELNIKFERIVKTLKKKDADKKMLRAAEVIRDDAKNRAPARTGKLKQAIVASLVNPVKKYRKYGGAHGEPEAYAGIDYAIAPHAHLVEYGVFKPRSAKGKVLFDGRTGQFFGKEVANMPAKPFFRPAIDSNKDLVVQVIAKGLKELIGKEIRRGK